MTCDAIVSPANSFGFMDGGLDAALVERFGMYAETRPKQTIRDKHAGELLVGRAEVCPTNDSTVPWLICAPTMRVPHRRHVASRRPSLPSCRRSPTRPSFEHRHRIVAPDLRCQPSPTTE